MASFVRTMTLVGILFLPAAANAAMWEFTGFMDDDQALTSMVPDSYFGGGFVSALLDTGTGEFNWFVSFGGLTTEETNAHFHLAPPGSSGGVVQTLIDESVRTGTSTTGSYVGSATLDAAKIASLTTNSLTGLEEHIVGDVTDWYANIHTGDSPDGEIRGQLGVSAISAVPLPAAIWLFLPAVVMLARVRRRP